MAVYVAGRDLTDKGEFRSTLSFLWLVLNVVLVVNYAQAGSIDGESARLSLILGGSLLVGLGLGDWLHHRVDQRIFRVLVFALLLVAGGVLAASKLA